MHYLRIDLPAAPAASTCSYAIRFGTFLAALFTLEPIVHARGRRQLIMDKDDDN